MAKVHCTHCMSAYLILEESTLVLSYINSKHVAYGVVLLNGLHSKIYLSHEMLEQRSYLTSYL